MSTDLPAYLSLQQQEREKAGCLMSSKCVLRFCVSRCKNVHTCAVDIDSGDPIGATCPSTYYQNYEIVFEYVSYLYCLKADIWVDPCLLVGLCCLSASLGCTLCAKSRSIDDLPVINHLPKPHKRITPLLKKSCLLLY